MVEIKKQKKLVIDTPELILKELKKRAIDRGITLRKYVLGILINEMKREDESQ